MPEPETGAGGGVKTGTITPDTPARPGFVGRHRAYPDLTGKRVTEGGRRLGGGPRSGTADEPLVTILTVCWNSAATIEQTIRSVREQTYGAIEHVVVIARRRADNAPFEFPTRQVPGRLLFPQLAVYASLIVVPGIRKVRAFMEHLSNFK